MLAGCLHWVDKNLYDELADTPQRMLTVSDKIAAVETFR